MHADGTAANGWEAIRAHWRLKALLSVGMTGAFAVLYLSAQRFPVGTIRPAPATPFDHWIPWMPSAFYVYMSLLLFQAIAPWSMRAVYPLLVYCRTLLLVTIAAAIVFVLWPTACPRPADTTAAGCLYRGYVGLDNELNAFPSLHAAFIVYSALGCGWVLTGARHRAAILAAVWVWAAGILVATLLTKQHVILDLVAGAALGWAGHRLFRRRARLDPNQGAAGAHRVEPKPVQAPGRATE